MGEQIGGISVSMVYDGTLLAGLFGLHYQNVTEVNGETVRYAFNAGSLAKSTFAWKNSPAGFFISTDGGKTWGYGWEKDDSPVKTALLLENTLQELDERYCQQRTVRACADHDSDGLAPLRTKKIQ